MALRRLLLVLALVALSPLPAGAAPSAPPTALEKAQQKVSDYLRTVPNLPKDVVVVPAVGEVLWPGSPAKDDVRSEIWMVVPRGRENARPLLYFAVRLETGEVTALFMRSLEEHPTYH